MTAWRCRLCGGTDARSVADLGDMPLANAYPDAATVQAGRERRHPLHVRMCAGCLLVQADAAVAVSAIFSDYAYFASCSTSWVAHAQRHAAAMTAMLGLHAGSLVVEVASNDGYLLQHFVAAGIPVLGIEPAANVAAVAQARGIATSVRFFDAACGRGLAADGVGADLMVANNVLAHVPDLGDFVAGFAALLRPQGVITFEFPHLLALLRDCQFDTLYHEHVAYLSLLVVERVLAAAGLRAFDVAALPTHGGSLRLFACHRAADWPTRSGLIAMRATEQAAGLHRVSCADGFAGRMTTATTAFRAFLTERRAAGRVVAAYGAAAKGNTFLNACGVGADDIAMVADRSPAKQGRLLPGSHIPVVTPAALRAARPDDVVILPWNLAHEIAAELRDLPAQLWVAMPALLRIRPPARARPPAPPAVARASRAPAGRAGAAAAP